MCIYVHTYTTTDSFKRLHAYTHIHINIYDYVTIHIEKE